MDRFSRIIFCLSITVSINQTPPVNQMRKKKGSVVKVLAPSQVGSNTEHMDTNVISSAIQVGRIFSDRTPSVIVSIPSAFFHVQRRFGFHSLYTLQKHVE